MNVAEIQKTVDVLERHNRWRRGDETVEQADPAELGKAIDFAVGMLKSYLAYRNR